MNSDADRFAGLRRDGKSRDEILAAMKEGGLSMIQAIKAAMELFDIGLGEAKSIVTGHPSWIDTARSLDPLHEQILRVLRDPDDLRD